MGKVTDLKNKSKGFLGEFKEFAMRGNVIDLAVGVIIGGAFQGIVTSLVNDVIMPLIGGIFGKVDFSNLLFTIGESQVKYGAFITAVINFVIMAFIIFLMVKGINSLKRLGEKKEEVVEAVTTKVCPYCKSEISIDATRCPHCTSEVE